MVLSDPPTVHSKPVQSCNENPGLLTPCLSPGALGRASWLTPDPLPLSMPSPSF